MVKTCIEGLIRVAIVVVLVVVVVDVDVDMSCFVQFRVELVTMYALESVLYISDFSYVFLATPSSQNTPL